MTIEAKIICDSTAINGKRLTTFVLKYPRFIHSEFMTHRVFSRNASSSRAIPFEKQMKMIEEDIAMPLEFRENKKGMQAGEALPEYIQEGAKIQWKLAAQQALFAAQSLAALGVHKQYVNRLVEPFAHISVVCSATEYANFFALRHHSMAQPEIAELARQMWEAYRSNEPEELGHGEWHLPFITPDDRQEQNINLIDLSKGDGIFLDNYFWMQDNYWLPLVKRSVAKCARVSFMNHEGKPTTQEEDLKLYDRLLGAPPIHASPAEHQARCDVDWGAHCWDGNFCGWRQYRKRLEGENISTFNGPLG